MSGAVPSQRQPCGSKRSNDETRVPDGSVFAPAGKRQATADGFCTTNVVERITDPTRLAQRQKQVDYGKNTLAYERYAREVPRSERGKGCPWTPDIGEPNSKRAFDGKLKAWRRDLHEWENDHPDESSVVAAKTAGVTGLAELPGASGGATSFDDFLDGQLDDDDDDDASALLPPAAPSFTPPPVAAPQPPEQPPSSASAAGSLRARLDEFKAAKPPPAAKPAQHQAAASIFGTFDDGGLV